MQRSRAPKRGWRASVLAGLLLAAPVLHAQFTDVTDAVGTGGEPGGSFPVAGGASFADLDGDGRLDLLVNAAAFHVFQQQPDATFVDRGAELGLSDAVFGGHLPFDMDADGDLDLLLLGPFGDALLRNEGGLRFTDVTATHLPGMHEWSAAAAPGDFDADGDVDLYVTTYIARLRAPMHDCEPDRVLLNDGEGRFHDATEAIGLDVRGCGLAVTTLDADGDGDVDVMVANDFGLQVVPSVLLRNDGPSEGAPLTFTDVSAATGFDAGRVYAMGIAIGDVDLDGRPDALMSSIGPPALLVGSETGYVDATRARGLDVRTSSIGWQTTWGVALEDFDRDGHLDAFLAGGQIAATLALHNGADQANVVMRGDGRGGFEAAPAWRADAPRGTARGLAIGDIDGDGDPDLAIAHSSGSAAVHRNDLAGPPPLRVTLRASETSPGAEGATVEARCAEHVRHHWQTGGGSFAGARGGPLRVTFPAPCDEAGRPVVLQVRFPSGHVQRVDTTTGAQLVVTEEDWVRREGGMLRVTPRDDGGALLGAGDDVAVTVAGVRRAMTWTGSAFEAPLADGADARVDVGGVFRPLDLRAPSHRAHVHPLRPAAGETVRLALHGPAAESALVEWVRGAERAPMIFADGTWSTTAVVPATPEPFELHVDGVAVAAGTLEAFLEVDRARSEIRHGGRLALPDAATFIRFYGRLRDANGRRVDPAVERLAILVDGEPAELLPRARSEDGSFDLRIAREGLREGAELALALDGVPVEPPRTYHALAAFEDVLAHLHPAQSRCAPSMRYADADGHDVVGMLVSLRDEFGESLPTSADAPLPSLASERLSALGEPVALSWSLVQDFRAGTTPGLADFEVQWFGRALGVRCGVELVEAREPPAMDAARSGLEVVPFEFVVDTEEPVEVVWRPRAADGRLLGSGARGVWSTDLGELVGEPRYLGIGEWAHTLRATGATGEGEGEVTVASNGEVVRARFTVLGAPLDAGAADAGPDAEVAEDGGSPGDPDAGVVPDASSPDAGGSGGGGGGCAAGALGGPSAGAWLLSLWLLARRREGRR